MALFRAELFRAIAKAKLVRQAPTPRLPRSAPESARANYGRRTSSRTNMTATGGPSEEPPAPDSQPHTPLHEVRMSLDSRSTPTAFPQRYERDTPTRCLASWLPVLVFKELGAEPFHLHSLLSTQVPAAYYCYGDSHSINMDRGINQLMRG